MTESTEANLMEYRKLGHTEFEVSVVGFGASPLGNVFHQTDPAEGRRAVHLAIERGINFFDVSPYYGLTLAETRLGEALAGLRHKVVLATKCGRYGAEEFDFSAKRITAGLEDSLKRLQTDHVDLLQAHDVEFGNVQQIIDETIPAMRRLQEQGKTRSIGITGYPLNTLARIAKAVPVDTILSYCRYNLMITDMDAVLTPLARECGIGLINASALNMGILTERGAPDWHPAPQSLREAGQKAAKLCRSRGVDLSELALRFAFDHPYVSSTLVGISSQAHLHAALQLLSAQTDRALVEEVRSLMAPLLDYVWPSGRPENHG